ncbi:uncharacterized protein LOC107042745 isoform X2 [Diachasma alloeum]|uniref:uncharacterized protein LOC107042745 isoform X2 n=1 Tax=Diachasma alloeum TaxID=454923 RepID=UPI00073827A7|nr:uncharacterized protein LOC107042745 isoform X2 [Diachasma alloeum]XP_015119410.1 uncharacterized protein LOC107042745 isoform X2 [Diachasma alloeum]
MSPPPKKKKNLTAKICVLEAPIKTAAQCMTVWKNLKTKVKTKYQKLYIADRSTGNPTAAPELTDQEHKILSIIGSQSTVGVTGVPASGFGPSGSENDSNAVNQQSTVEPGSSKAPPLLYVPKNKHYCILNHVSVIFAHSNCQLIVLLFKNRTKIIIRS